MTTVAERSAGAQIQVRWKPQLACGAHLGQGKRLDSPSRTAGNLKRTSALPCGPVSSPESQATVKLYRLGTAIGSRNQCCQVHRKAITQANT